MLKIVASIVLMSAMISCNTNNKTKTTERSNLPAETAVIPEAVVQFLMTSAASDFRNHQPPTPIDFRNVKVGYLKSPESDTLFVLCGEFLSKEESGWIEFTTIKTSGYEQYIGKTQYCHDATMVLTDQKLSVELKNKLAEDRSIGK